MKVMMMMIIIVFIMIIIIVSPQMMVSLDRTPHVWTQEEVLIILMQIKIIIVIKVTTVTHKLYPIMFDQPVG